MNPNEIDQLAANDPTYQAWGNTVDTGEGPNHKIDMSVAGGAFAAKYYGAWHDLGRVTQENVTARELLVMAGGLYPIFRLPIVARLEVPISEGSPITVFKEAVDQRRCNYARLHPTTGELQILGQASKDYPLWTNEDVFCGFADTLIDVGQPTCSTCGVLDEGRQAFMSFELPAGIRVGGMADETVRLWMTVLTSYDSSAPTTCYISSIRGVCANTVRAGRAQAFSTYTVRKTKLADLKVQYAREALGLVPQFTEAFQEEMDQLVATQLTNQKFEEIVTGLFGPGEGASKITIGKWAPKLGKLNDLFRTADTQENVRGTAYAGLQAVTEFIDWNSTIKNFTGPENGARLWRSMTGTPSVTGPKDAMRDALLALV